MSLISEWSTTADDNGTLGPVPYYWPENQPPSSVNNCARQMMATIRSQWNDAEWFNWGYTVTRVLDTKIKVVDGPTSNVNADEVFKVGGRLKLEEGLNTIYATIDEASASATSLNVTFTPDTGVLAADPDAVFNSIISPDNSAIPPVLFPAIPADVVRQRGAQIYAVATGMANTYAVSLTPALTAYTNGLHINVRINIANTGNSTLNVNGLGAIFIRKNVSENLVAGDLIANQVVSLVYDTGIFQLQSTQIVASSASNAQQQTGAAINVYTSPGTQQSHLSAAKAWAYFTIAAGVITVQDSYNIINITRNGAGNYVVNFTTAFANANYVPAIYPISNPGTFMGPGTMLKNTGSCNFLTGYVSTLGGGFTISEPDAVHIIFFGRQI